MDIATKLGDTAPLARYQLVGKDGTPVNLTGATVVQRFAGAPQAGSPCEVDGDPTDGIVRLSSRDHLPDVPDGRRQITVEFETEVTFINGDVQTFPTEGYDRAIIWTDLDHKAV